MNKKLIILSLIFLCVTFQQNFLLSVPVTLDVTNVLTQIKGYLPSIETCKQNTEKTAEFAGAHIGGAVGVGLFTLAAFITFELIARKVIKSSGRDVGVLWDVIRACLFPITPHHIEIILAHKKLALEVFALYGTLTVGTVSMMLSSVNAGIRTKYVANHDWNEKLQIKKIIDIVDKMHLKSL